MKRFLLILLFSFTSSAQAAEWMAVRTDPNSDQYFYDRSKLFMGGDEITYWKKVIFRVPQPAKNQFATSGLYRERINCTEHTLRTISYLLYAGDGNVIENIPNHEGEASPIIPDTLGDLFERKVCPILWQKQEEQRIKRAEEDKKKADEAAKKIVLPAENKNAAPVPAPEKPATEAPHPTPAATPASKETTPSQPAP